MNKLSKIFLVIIVILLLTLGLMTYYMFYWRNGYLNAANAMYEHAKLLEDSGVQIISIDDGDPQVHITKSDKVIIEDINK